MFSSKLFSYYHIGAVHAIEVATAGGRQVGREFLWTIELLEYSRGLQPSFVFVFVFVFVSSTWQALVAVRGLQPSPTQVVVGALMISSTWGALSTFIITSGISIVLRLVKFPDSSSPRLTGRLIYVDSQVDLYCLFSLSPHLQLSSTAAPYRRPASPPRKDH